MWPFVGRQDELDNMIGALRDPHDSGFIVAGAAGVGKSRLAREFADRLAGTEYVVRTVSATSVTSDVAFGALAMYLEGRATPAPGQSVLITELARRLAAAPAGGRAVVIVDDAHLLDLASVAVLRQLVRAHDAFLFAVTRSGEPGTRDLAPLWTEGLVRRVELPALCGDEIEELLEQALDGQVGVLTVQRLRELTGGNPLLLRELVTSGLDSAALSPVNGVWIWHGPWLAAPRLTELVQSRIGDLGVEQQWALELVALSEPVSLDVLTRLVTEDLLLDLEGQGLLQVLQDGSRTSVRLAHPLYAEALREACPPLRTRHAKRKLSEALAAAGTNGADDALQIARWRLDAGVAVDMDVLRAAAQRAWSILDLPLAERLAREAVTAALSAGQFEQMHLAGVTLWRVLIAGERHTELLALIDAVACRADQPEQRAGATIARAETLFWGLGDYDGAMKELGSVADSDSAAVLIGREHAGLYPLLHGLAGGLLEAQDAIAEDTQRMADPESAPKLGVAAELTATFGGRWLAGSVAAELDSRGVPEVAELPWITPLVALLRTQRRLLEGRLEAAAEVAGQAHRAALGLGWDFAIMLSSVGNAQVARFAGRIDEAGRWLSEARALYSPTSNAGRIFYGLLAGEQACVAAMAGEHAAGAAALASLPDHEWVPGRVFTLWAELARPWVSAAQGAVQAAQAQALAVAERARWSGAYAVEVLALHDLVRLGGDAPVARLRTLAAAEPDPGHPVHRCFRHAEALVARDPVALEAVAAEFEQSGRLPIAAEVYRQASRHYRDRGKADSARRCRAFAVAIGDRCPGVSPMPGESDDFALTTREREIAVRALSGRTNREIAADIGVAKRTIDNHLARVYSKLGIGTRDELRRLLGRID
ncbi:AAA family ATPase [Nocardia sp. NPDC051832]|uniref:AAA family ATPase n=1 Tax=Nocardia sp. NPDC051832 TaxID=3155673 RepID=UPI003417CE6C